MNARQALRYGSVRRALRLEGLERRLLMAADLNDSLSEATNLGAVSTTAKTVAASIATDVDVNMYRFAVTAGQVVDFDIDTPQNGPGGLGSYLRLFDAQGRTLAFNNDAAAPGENAVGFDAYLRHTFTTAGTFFIGVSNANNRFYDPLTGDGDRAGGANAVGGYQLTVQSLPVDTNDSLSEATSLGAVSTGAKTINATIATDVDVNIYRFSVTAGQVVDFDIDTPQNGPGGLGSYLRLFDAQGRTLAFNNDAAAPGEATVGFDSYLRYTFAAAGTYYIGVSNWNNRLYDPVTGNGDMAGGLNSVGAYQLIVQTAPVAAVRLAALTNGEPLTAPAGGLARNTAPTTSLSAASAPGRAEEGPLLRAAGVDRIWGSGIDPAGVGDLWTSPHASPTLANRTSQAGPHLRNAAVDNVLDRAGTWAGVN